MNKNRSLLAGLTDLIAQAKAKDPQLSADLGRKLKILSSRLPFGLNFERHRPNAIGLPQHPFAKGDKARLPLALGLIIDRARQHRLTKSWVPTTGAGIACILNAPDHLLPVNSSLISG